MSSSKCTPTCWWWYRNNCLCRCAVHFLIKCLITLPQQIPSENLSLQIALPSRRQLIEWLGICALNRRWHRYTVPDRSPHPWSSQQYVLEKEKWGKKDAIKEKNIFEIRGITATLRRCSIVAKFSNENICRPFRAISIKEVLEKYVTSPRWFTVRF